MRAKKTRAFELFDEGKRPSDSYGEIDVTKRTLYAYYQEWKKAKAREREEVEKQRRQEEVKARLAREEVGKQRKRAAIATELQQQEQANTRRIELREKKERQRRQNLESHFQGLIYKIRDLEWQMWRAGSKPNNEDEVQRIGAFYSQACQSFSWVVSQLYPKETNPDRLLAHVTEEVFNRSVFNPKNAVATTTGTTGKGKRDYMLDARGLPIYVGEGVGDLDHDEAVRLSVRRLVGRG